MVDTLIRSTPNKRMPAKNSPTNETGVLDNTMTQEFVVIMRREQRKTASEKRKAYTSITSTVAKSTHARKNHSNKI